MISITYFIYTRFRSPSTFRRRNRLPLALCALLVDAMIFVGVILARVIA